MKRSYIIIAAFLCVAVGGFGYVAGQTSGYAKGSHDTFVTEHARVIAAENQIRMYRLQVASQKTCVRNVQKAIRSNLAAPTLFSVMKVFAGQSSCDKASHLAYINRTDFDVLTAGM